MPKKNVENLVFILIQQPEFIRSSNFWLGSQLASIGPKLVETLTCGHLTWGNKSGAPGLGRMGLYRLPSRVYGLGTNRHG